MNNVNSNCSFSDITETYIEYCRGMEEMLKELCREDENINYLVNLLFNDYKLLSKEWIMQKEMNFIISECCSEEISDNIDFIREWSQVKSDEYDVVNPISTVISFLTYFVHCSLNKIVYEETGSTLGIKLANDFSSIEAKVFSSEKEMKRHGYTNRAKDYVSLLHRTVEKYMKENNLKV